MLPELHHVTPQGNITMANALFWDKAAEKYAASKINDMAGYEQTLTRARSYLSKDNHLLEVGCGTGGTAIKLSSSVARVTATDISREMLAFGEGKLDADNRGVVNFMQATATHPHADAPFDAACAFSLLHLIDDLDEGLAHLHNQIKPGGFLITKTACLRDMSFAMPALVKVMQWIGKAPHVLVFDAKQLETAFEKAGFEVVEAGYHGKTKSTRFVVGRRI